MSLSENRRFGGGEAGQPDSPLTAVLGPALPLAEEVRCLCRSAVLMQRTCHTLLSECGDWMPVASQLQLLSILQVRQTA